MLRRTLLALAMVTATTAVTLPASSADPASALCPTTDGTNAGVKVPLSDAPVTVSVTDTRTGAPRAVVVMFTDGGTRFTLSGPPEPRPYVIDDASWCLKSAKGNTVPVIGTGATGASPTSNKKGELVRIDYVTVFTVSVAPGAFVCLNSSTPGAPDVEQVGAWDTKDNLAAWGSTDGTCSGEQAGRETMVTAVTVEEANAKCLAAGEPGAEATLATYGYPLPDYVWVCTQV